MRCLLVDDERLARNNLRALLKAHPELTIVGEASDSQQAEEAIRRFKPDLVFLDIQLNDGNGFDLLERLDPAPRIIFVTAHDRFAVRAFEVNALDYLLKPVDPDRLKKAVERLTRDWQAKTHPPVLHPVTVEDSVLIPAGRSGYFIRVADILAIEAKGNYSIVLTQNGRAHTIFNTLANWEHRLPDATFCRVGRKWILNLRQIRNIEPSGRHVYVEVGSEGHRIELQRAAADRLKQIFSK